MMTHDEIGELVAAYALDAVVGDEYRDVELHLEQCPRCRSELDVYRDVAAALGNSVAPLPEDLWLNIVRRLSQEEDTPATMPRLFSEPVVETASAAHRRRRRLSTRSGFAIVGTIVGAAAAAAVILGVGLIRSNDEVSQLQSAPGGQPSTVVAALEAPGHKIVNLGNGNARTVAQFVLVDGRGYLVSSALPTLGDSETYQLWGVVNGQPISLGLLGQSPSNSVFTVAGSQAPSQLRVTIEPSGGSVVPSGTLVASGLV